MTPAEKELVEKVLDRDPDSEDLERLRQAILEERLTTELLIAMRKHLDWCDEVARERQARQRALNEEFGEQACAAAVCKVRAEMQGL